MGFLKSLGIGGDSGGLGGLLGGVGSGDDSGGGLGNLQGLLTGQNPLSEHLASLLTGGLLGNVSGGDVSKFADRLGSGMNQIAKAGGAEPAYVNHFQHAAQAPQNILPHEQYGQGSPSISIDDLAQIWPHLQQQGIY